MNPQNLQIRSVENATHDVLRFRTEKPSEITFTPGQAADISINKDAWSNEVRPFTFTSLPGDDFLEFTIKTYPERKGVTNELLSLKADDELIISGVFGAISYKGEGFFIAGGAGVTPFISILRSLRNKNKIENNKLIFANKTQTDIINEKEFKSMLGNNFINILSEEKTGEYDFGHINEGFLKNNISDFNKFFYICGPPAMMDAVESLLSDLEVDTKFIVKEEF